MLTFRSWIDCLNTDGIYYPRTEKAMRVIPTLRASTRPFYFTMKFQIAQWCEDKFATFAQRFGVYHRKTGA